MLIAGYTKHFQITPSREILLAGSGNATKDGTDAEYRGSFASKSTSSTLEHTNLYLAAFAAESFGLATSERELWIQQQPILHTRTLKWEPGWEHLITKGIGGGILGAISVFVDVHDHETR